jgi:hypothetical protein
MIDGSLFCCVICEDIAFDQEHCEYIPSVDCEDYVAVERLNDILKEYVHKIKDDADEQLKEFIDERIDHFGG